MKVLYHVLTTKPALADAKMTKVSLIGFDELPAAKSCRLLAQILHVKKASTVGAMVFNKDRTKSCTTAWCTFGKYRCDLPYNQVVTSIDCLTYMFETSFRDCKTGTAFAVMAQDLAASKILFHCQPKLGTYVYLYMPMATNQSIVGDTPKVNYLDVLYPAKEVPFNTLLTQVLPGKSFAPFLINLPVEQFEMLGVNRNRSLSEFYTA
jgi:hypothetical protein